MKSAWRDDSYMQINSDTISQLPSALLRSQMDGWMNQAYSRLSTTHGHITDRMLDSVVYAAVSVGIL